MTRMVKSDFNRDDAIKKIVASLGEGTYVLSSDKVYSKIHDWVGCGSRIGDVVISGSFADDKPIIPFGRITEVYGEEGVGKTTFMSHVMVNVQKKGGFVVLADTEEAVDFKYMQKLGVKTEAIIRVGAVYIEDVFKKFTEAIKIIQKDYADVPILLAWDSVGGTTSKDEEEAVRKGKKSFAVAARIIGQHLRVINPLLARTKAALLLNNRVYGKTDLPTNVAYQDKFQTYGGKSIKFFASLRIMLRRKSKLYKDNADANTREVFGHRVEIIVIKNKVYDFLRSATTVVIGGVGFCDDYRVFELLITHKPSIQQLPNINKVKNTVIWTPKGKEIKFTSWDSYKKRVVSHSRYFELRDSVIGTFFKEREEDEFDTQKLYSKATKVFKRKRDAAKKSGDTKRKVSRRKSS